MARRRTPPRPLAALLVVVAVVGVTWAFLTPPWEVSDEPQHFSYVQTLFEEHHLPGRGSGGGEYSEDLYQALSATNFNAPIFLPFANTEWSHIKADAAKRRMLTLPDDTGGGPTLASSNPPIYYLFDLPAYAVFSATPTTSRMYALRLWNVSLLLVAATAGWVLAGAVVGPRPLGQLVAGATLGLWPMASALTAGVNPDGMLFTAWAVAFALGGVIVRHGLTARRGVALGVAVGVACLVKATSFALIPGTAALLLGTAWRRRSEAVSRRWIAAPVASLVALVALPLTWALYSRTGGASGFAQISGAASGGSGVNVRQFISYLWQFYLPKLPFMEPRIEFLYPIISHKPVLNTWLGSGTATLGWTNTWFPPWVYWVVGWCLVLIVVTLVIGAVRQRPRLRTRGAALAIVSYVGVSAVLIALGTHYTDFNFFRTGGMPFAQGRYILPGVLPLLAVVACVAVERAGHHRAALAGTVLGGLAVLQVAALGLVVDRWYVA